MKKLLIALLIFSRGSVDNQNCVPPTIIGPTSLSLPCNKDTTINDILSHFKFYDDDTPIDELVIYFEEEVILNRPNYETHTLCCEDNYHNISKHRFSLNIYDNIEPKIIGPDAFTFSTYSSPKIEYILDEYYAIDECDGRINVLIERENYSDNYHIEGIYYISLVAFDNSKNAARKTVTINIEKEVSNIFFMDNISIKVSSDRYISPDEMITELRNESYIENIDYTNAEYISSEYPLFYKSIGVYPTILSIHLNDTRSSKLEIHLNIIVTEEYIENEYIEKNPTIFDYLWMMIQAIIDFFLNL